MVQLNLKFRLTIQSCVAAALLAVQAPTVSAVTTNQVLRGVELAAAVSRIFAVPAAYVQPTDENKSTLAKLKVLADAVRVTSDALMFFNHVDESTAPLYNGLWASVDTGFLVKHICDVFDPEVEQVSLPQDVALDPETSTTVEKILTNIKPVLPAIECLLASWVAWLGIQNDPLTTALRVRLQSCLSLTRTLEEWSDHCLEPSKRYYFALVAIHLALTFVEFYRSIEIRKDAVVEKHGLKVEDKRAADDEEKKLPFMDYEKPVGPGDVENEQGERFLYGLGTKTDEVRAVGLFRQAADLGNVDAMWNLGNCFKNGWGLAEDENEAMDLYRRAADRNHPLAMNELGRHGDYGENCDDEYDRDGELLLKDFNYLKKQSEDVLKRAIEIKRTYERGFAIHAQNVEMVAKIQRLNESTAKILTEKERENTEARRRLFEIEQSMHEKSSSLKH